MTRIDFAPLFRSTIGFDRMMQAIDDALAMDEASSGFPPYNIERLGEDRYRITLAVAGFARNDLQIDQKDDSLVVRGLPETEENGREFLHRGIAGRAFERRFQLAEHVKVTGAELQNGLLSIELVRELPEAMRPRRIEIGTGTGTPRLVEATRTAA